MTASCPAEERLAARALGDLDPGDAAAVDAHAETCPDCAGALDLFRRAVAVVREAPRAEAPPAPLAALLAAQAAERAEVRPGRNAERRRVPRRLVPLAAAAALAVGVFLSGWWAGRATAPAAGTGEPGAPAAVPAREVPPPPLLAFEPAR